MSILANTPEELFINELYSAQERLTTLVKAFEQLAGIAYRDVTKTRENLLYWIKMGPSRTSGISGLTEEQRETIGVEP